ITGPPTPWANVVRWWFLNGNESHGKPATTSADDRRLSADGPDLRRVQTGFTRPACDRSGRGVGPRGSVGGQRGRIAPSAARAGGARHRAGGGRWNPCVDRAGRGSRLGSAGCVGRRGVGCGRGIRTRVGGAAPLRAHGRGGV